MTITARKTAMDAEEAARLYNNYFGEVTVVVKGDLLPRTSFTMLAVGGGMYSGLSANGKTLMSKAMAASVMGVFKRIQLTPEVLSSDLTGYFTRDPLTGERIYEPGPFEGSHVVLADEANRARLSVPGLLEVVEERQITIGGISHPVEDALTIVYTKNPDGYDQTASRMSPALKSRIPMVVPVSYIGLEDELDVAFGATKKPSDITPTMTPEDILRLRALNRRTIGNTSRDIGRIGVVKIRETRTSNLLEHGADLRASNFLLKVAAAFANIDGRNAIREEDLQEAFPMVVAGRIEPVDYMTEEEIFQFAKDLWP